MKSKINFKNIIAYIQGKCRYYFYYSSKKRFIRKHIREQIEARINSMNKTCFYNGTCVSCGCVTTALQMANKPCNEACYPPMFTKKSWKDFKYHGGLYFEPEKSEYLWRFDLKNNKFIKV